MKDYLKSFHDSLQGQKVNTYVKLGFCCDEEIRLELRRQLIRMLNRHSQIFIMMLTVQLPEAYVDATETLNMYGGLNWKTRYPGCVKEMQHM